MLCVQCGKLRVGGSLIIRGHKYTKLRERMFSVGAYHILGDPGAVSRGRAKWRDESFQERAEEPLGTKSHRTISKRLCEYRLLIGQKKIPCIILPNRRAATLESLSCVLTRRLLSCHIYLARAPK